jgi:hypothetical protein
MKAGWKWKARLARKRCLRFPSLYLPEIFMVALENHKWALLSIKQHLPTISGKFSQIIK